MTIVRVIDRLPFNVEVSLALSDHCGYMIAVHRSGKLESAVQSRIDRQDFEYGVSSFAYKMAKSNARRIVRDKSKG